MKENKKKTALIIIALFFGLCVSPSIIGIGENVPRFDGDITIVSIQPPAQDVEKGEWFNVGIYVEPSEPIIGVAADIYFDPTLIQADQVYDGDPHFFEFFYPGTIDNINGKITGIAGVGSSAVCYPEYLCYISFFAQQKLGTSPLDIQNVAIADPNGDPLPSTVIDGEVTVGESPQITNVMLMTSDPLDTEPDFGWENVSCAVTDNEGVDEVEIHITYPDLHTEQIPMNKNGDTYYYNTTFTDACEYTYYIWANDTNDNENTSTPEKTFILPPNYEVDMDYETRTIDFWDLVEVVKHYGDAGTPGWIREDVDNNGDVDFWDIVEVVKYYGEEW